ncbi:MAG: hypothetical protein ACRDRL_16235, partial [Sciscionella sp.]
PQEDEAAVAASGDYLRMVLAAHNAAAQAWMSVQHTWPRAWQELAEFSDMPLRITVAEARQLHTEIAELVARYRRHDPGDRPGTPGVPADAVIVSAQYHLFPNADQLPPDAPRAP